MMAKSRKREVCVIKELWLLGVEETESFIKVFPSVGISGNNEGFSGRNSGFSKEKTPKEKERKEYIYTSPAGHPPTEGWFKDPEIDQAFSSYLQMRFNRGDQLTEIQIKALIDSIPVYEKIISKAIDNEYRRWPILQNKENWALKDPYNTYDEAIDSMKTWMERRYNWIDGRY